jgi:hypothetical protein
MLRIDYSQFNGSSLLFNVFAVRLSLLFTSGVMPPPLAIVAEPHHFYEKKF